MPLADFDAAAKMRDVITLIVRQVLANERPSDTYGVVTDIDVPAQSATVLFPGGGAVTVPMRTIQPYATGAVVRVAGESGDRYIDDVVSGGAALRVATPVTAITAHTTLDETHSIVLCGNTSTIVVTLPSAVGIRGRRYTIKRTSTGLVAVASVSLIDNAIVVDMTSAHTCLVVVSDGTVWRIESFMNNVGSAEVLASETTGSTGAFIDLTTAGPLISVVTGTKAVAVISAQCGQGGGGDNIMGVSVSGASTVAATVDESAYFPPGMTGTLTGLIRFTALTPGLNTFRMKYYASLGTGTYMRRRIAVFPSM